MAVRNDATIRDSRLDNQRQVDSVRVEESARTNIEMTNYTVCFLCVRLLNVVFLLGFFFAAMFGLCVWSVCQAGKQAVWLAGCQWTNL